MKLCKGHDVPIVIGEGDGFGMCEECITLGLATAELQDPIIVAEPVLLVTPSYFQDLMKKRSSHAHVARQTSRTDRTRSNDDQSEGSGDVPRVLVGR